MSEPKIKTTVTRGKDGLKYKFEFDLNLETPTLRDYGFYILERWDGDDKCTAGGGKAVYFYADAVLGLVPEAMHPTDRVIFEPIFLRLSKKDQDLLRSMVDGGFVAWHGVNHRDWDADVIFDPQWKYCDNLFDEVCHHLKTQD